MKNNEFKITKGRGQTTYTLESATGGSTSAGSVASVSQSLGGVRKQDNILAQETNKKVNTPKPRNFVAKNAKTGGAGQHADKKKAEKQGTAKHKKPYMESQGVAENFNAEYDDEAGMAHTNLHTIARAAQGLIDTIDDKENLPEWAQEKIAKVEGMLTAVWDYLESQEEQGIQEAHGDPRDKGAADAWYHRPYRNPFPKGSPEHAEYTAGFEGDEEGSAGGKQYDRSEHPYKQHTDRDMYEAELDEKAPPGMEAEVMRLKKQYPGEPEKAFATAWSIYNKKHGKKEEGADPYFESLEMALERQLEPHMPLGTWEKNFLNANPYRYHQFKNKTPAKKK